MKNQLMVSFLLFVQVGGVNAKISPGEINQNDPVELKILKASADIEAAQLAAINKERAAQNLPLTTVANIEFEAINNFPWGGPVTNCRDALGGFGGSHYKMTADNSSTLASSIPTAMAVCAMCNSDGAKFAKDIFLPWAKMQQAQIALYQLLLAKRAIDKLTIRDAIFAATLPIDSIINAIKNYLSLYWDNILKYPPYYETARAKIAESNEFNVNDPLELKIFNAMNDVEAAQLAAINKQRAAQKIPLPPTTVADIQFQAINNFSWGGNLAPCRSAITGFGGKDYALTTDNCSQMAAAIPTAMSVCNRCGVTNWVTKDFLPWAKMQQSKIAFYDLLVRKRSLDGFTQSERDVFLPVVAIDANIELIKKNPSLYWTSVLKYSAKIEDTQEDINADLTAAGKEDTSTLGRIVEAVY